jgi:hypothetical protein
MRRGRKVMNRLPAGQTCSEEPLIPWAEHHQPAVTRQFVGKVLAVARADNVARRV